MKPHRIQVRLNENIYSELLKQSILLDIPLSQIVRLKLQDRKISKEVATYERTE
jgi:hypothetical protein